MITLAELAQKYAQGEGSVAASAEDVHAIIEWYNDNRIPAPVDTSLAESGIPNVIIFGRMIMVER